MHPFYILSPLPFQLACSSDGFYVRLVEAVVSFILDYKQLLIIFICASKFILVLILTAPPPLPPFVTLPSAHFLANSSKRMSFWPAFPAVFLLHALLLSHCCIACIVCLFVSLSACLYVSLSLSLLSVCIHVCMCICMSVYAWACFCEDKVAVISRTFCWLRCRSRCRRRHFICCAVYCFCCRLAFVAVAFAGFQLEVF